MLCIVVVFPASINPIASENEAIIQKSEMCSYFRSAKYVYLDVLYNLGRHHTVVNTAFIKHEFQCSILNNNNSNISKHGEIMHIKVMCICNAFSLIYCSEGRLFFFSHEHKQSEY